MAGWSRLDCANSVKAMRTAKGQTEGTDFMGLSCKNGRFENESQSAARGNAGGSVGAILAVATMGVKRAASDPSLCAPYIACLGRLSPKHSFFRTISSFSLGARVLTKWAGVL